MRRSGVRPPSAPPITLLFPATYARMPELRNFPHGHYLDMLRGGLPQTTLLSAKTQKCCSLIGGYRGRADLLRIWLLFHCLEAGGVDNFAKLGFRNLCVVIFHNGFFFLPAYFNLLHSWRGFQRLLHRTRALRARHSVNANSCFLSNRRHSYRG